jgi:hypothetical protein
MTGSAASLEDPTRWLGVAIAVAGALLANPDATSHGWTSFSARVLEAGRRTRGVLARFIPGLRRDPTVQAIAARVNAVAPTATASSRGIVGWGPGASIDQRIELLDERTRALDKEVAELDQAIRETEKRLRAERVRVVEELRRETEAVRKDVEALRLEILQSDASALPIIVAGVALSGLAPDAPNVPLWLGCLVLVAAVAVAGWVGSKIAANYSRQRAPRAI